MQEDVARMDESARDQILWAALRLGGGRGATFAPQDVIAVALAVVAVAVPRAGLGAPAMLM
jgi:hypothetical protein